ncbi:MAG: hypothetical protein J1E34_00480 [Oscillospiraceae bacterium]|nr:hypothetical protein [Oscillospiraceae bacterium]
MDKLIEQQNLLCDNDIDTPEQLAEYNQSCKDEIVELTEARSRLRNMLKTAERKGDTDKITEYKNDISILSARLKKLRRDIVICDRIEAQKPVIDERMDKCREKFEQNEMTRKKQQRILKLRHRINRFQVLQFYIFTISLAQCLQLPYSGK